MVLLTESAGDPSSLVAPLRNVVQGLDHTQPTYNVRTMDQFYQMRTITIFDMIIGTIGAMGLMGLGLAIVGLYGLVAYATSRRTKEIGIRMAIGAGRTAVLRMVLRQGLVLAVTGLVIGLLAGLGAERLLAAAFPSGDTRFDPTAHLLVAPIVLAATFVAAYIPARRAARLDPMKALRYEETESRVCGFPPSRRTMVREAHRERVEDALRLAIVHVRSHSRQRQHVLTVTTFASVSTMLPLQNGHIVGRVTLSSNCDSYTFFSVLWTAKDPYKYEA
jgi:predicted lysophospholipase L1 biosynthesis ABC-type transport system permease subunit